MATLHIDNQVRDYDSWKTTFDKFERFRADNGVTGYRITRDATDRNRISIELDFDNADEATMFRGLLEQIWETPQSRDELISHSSPRLVELVENRRV